MTDVGIQSRRNKRRKFLARELPFIAVLIIDTDKGTGEGQYFAKGGEDGGIYHS